MRSRFFHSRREVLRAVREMADDKLVSARLASTEQKQRAESVAAEKPGACPAASGSARPGRRDAETKADQTVVLSVPCGIARDLLDVAETLWMIEPTLYEHVEFIGIDLDPEALDLSRALTREHFKFDFRCVDAVGPGTLPEDVDVIVSLGFGEFLSDDVLLDFYRRCHAALRGEGRFITSAMDRDRIADYLARELAELHTHYRSTEHLTELLKSAGFKKIRTSRDKVGLQTLAVAEKTP
jgi:SAM-dependent methyltransferase